MTTSAVLTNTSDNRSWHIAISVETLIYLLLFLVALVMRWVKLGAVPLGELEARQAIAAWHLLSPDIPGSGSIGGVVTFAGAVISFLFATPTDAAARFVPMLGGIALIFTPLLFRKQLGRVATLLSIGLLTISPTMVVTSRQMTGSGLSMLGLVLTLAAFDRYARTERPHCILLAGIALGFALMADYGTLAALIALAGGVVFMLLTDKEGRQTYPALLAIHKNLPWANFLAGLVGTLIIIGTLFFIAPGGLGAVADQLGSFANGITYRSSGVPYLGLVILLYDPGLLLFGIVGIIQAYTSDQPWKRFLAGWGIAALFISLVYPGATPMHALWSVVPLAGLAGLALADLLGLEHDAPAWAPWAHAAAVATLLGLTFTRISNHLYKPLMLPIPSNVPPDQVIIQLPAHLLMALIWLILLSVLWLGVASMWGSRSAWHGLGLGIAVPAMLVALGQSGTLAFTRADSPYELFNQYPAQVTLTTLVDTAEQVSQLSTGNPTMASITVQADPDGTLAWALRDFINVSYVEQVTPDVQTIMAITPANKTDPRLGSSYVGQDLVIVRQWAPGRLTPQQFIKWIFHRTASDSPAGEIRVILWVREDIYRLIPAGGEPATEEAGEY
ncbi:MAG: glycosyltransferase family 39 protein [Anaerolineae bacterium]|nr:glycosyltransferase family 39 protein [Anaerolineae bacterium]